MLFRQWLLDAYHHYKKIQESENAHEAGVQEISGYILSEHFPEITRVFIFLEYNYLQDN